MSDEPIRDEQVEEEQVDGDMEEAQPERELIFSSETPVSLWRRALIEMGLGAMLGFAVAYFVMAFVMKKGDIPTDHPIIFFGGGLLGALGGLLVPGRWETLRIRAGLIILSRRRRSVEIRPEDVTLILAQDIMRQHETAEVRIRAAGTDRKVYLDKSDMKAAVQALQTVSTRAAGVVDDDEITAPVDGMGALTPQEVSDISGVLGREAWKAVVTACAFAACLVYILPEGKDILQNGLKGHAGIKGTVALAGAVIGLGWWAYKARCRFKAKRAFLALAEARPGSETGAAE